MKPIAYINVEKRTLEFAEPIKWHTPTVANLDRIPLFTKEALAQSSSTAGYAKKIESLIAERDELAHEIQKLHKEKKT